MFTPLYVSISFTDSMQYGTHHDRFAEEVFHLLSEVGIRSLGLLLCLKRYIPAVVVCKLTARVAGTVLTVKQVLHILQRTTDDEK